MRRVLAIGVPILLWGGALGACGTSNAAVDRGGECTFATDCVPGLVCVEQRNKTRVCTDDLSGVTGEPPDPGGGDDGGGAAEEGGADGGDPVPSDDASSDTAPPIDTGIDTGPTDAGTDA